MALAFSLRASVMGCLALLSSFSVAFAMHPFRRSLVAALTLHSQVRCDSVSRSAGSGPSWLSAATCGA